MIEEGGHGGLRKGRKEARPGGVEIYLTGGNKRRERTQV